MAYQSFGAEVGDSHSDKKLAAIRLPANLQGKTVLDLGCNEGYFALEAKRRGASRVVGLDHDAKSIAAAQKRASTEGLDIEFLVAKMDELPDGPFDVVLLLSALHYIEDPGRLLAAIRSALSPTGVLILEIGVASNSHGRVVARSLRSIDERFFATNELLRRVWLKDYSVKEVGPSVPQAGDPVPRYVFHCSPTVKTNVLFILGKGGIGKSTLASQFRDAPIISTDVLFSPIRTQSPRIEPAQRLYDATFADTHSIWATWERIKDEQGVRPYFASVVATAIRHCTGAGLVVVEGFVLEHLVAEVQTKLGDSYKCWTVAQS
jgi:ubiquinone/menaquinone biosynthesis C-methylase UbiE